MNSLKCVQTFPVWRQTGHKLHIQAASSSVIELRHISGCSSRTSSLFCMAWVIRATRLKTDWMSRSCITLCTCVCDSEADGRICPDVGFLWRQSGESLGLSITRRSHVCEKKTGPGERWVGMRWRELTSLGPWGSLLVSTKAQTHNHILHTHYLSHSNASLVVLTNI